MTRWLIILTALSLGAAVYFLAFILSPWFGAVALAHQFYFNGVVCMTVVLFFVGVFWGRYRLKDNQAAAFAYAAPAVLSICIMYAENSWTILAWGERGAVFFTGATVGASVGNAVIFFLNTFRLQRALKPAV